MRSINLWMRVAAISFVMLFVKIDCSSIHAATPVELQQPAACTAPEYHQLDFWIGDWDAYDVGGTAKVAHARVDSILNGCALHEIYEGAGGHKGESFTIYDASRKVWHQSWVTDRGQLLVIEGKLQAGEIVLSGVDRTATGEERHVRGTWKPAEGGVRETAVTSTDGGATWKPWFDIIFRPRGSAAADDAKIVGDLDTEYQAAVKVNDAATMDRILADDFVLVTGSGKSYTKADVLADTRIGNPPYEHNDELEKKVRVWGDTAFVTVKLWEKGIDAGK
ncbi:MAG: nuclear transport factor 2 family protein, partial [Candidatus Acidiferrales bacterium]